MSFSRVLLKSVVSTCPFLKSFLIKKLLSLSYQALGDCLRPYSDFLSLSMDFVTSLPNTPRGHDAILVIVARLTKSAHFISINISFPVSQLAEIYIRKIVKLHGVP